jgi:integrase/recombinase XerD
MSPLRKQMEADLAIRGLAYRTREAYAGSVVKLAKFYGRGPDRMRRETEFCLPRPKLPARLPQILSREEVAALIEQTTNLKHRTILMTTYAAGLRLSELCHLRVADIDSDRMTIRVEQGKGAKDRYTLLSARLLTELRRYWVAYRPRLWLFPAARMAEQPMPKKTPHLIYHSRQEGQVLPFARALHLVLRPTEARGKT